MSGRVDRNGIAFGFFARRRRAGGSSARADQGMVLLCGNRSSARVSGLTVAFDMLVEGYGRSGRPHVVIDKGAIGAASRVGAFNPARALKTVGLVLRFWLALPRARIVYNTVAPSRLGFARDASMIWPSRMLGRRIVLHLFGGGYGAFYEGLPRWFQGLVRTTLAQAHAIVVEGRLLREQFGFVDGIDTKLRVVPNGLPAGIDPNGIEPKAAPPPGEPVRLLYMSNMIESKGYLEVLEACRLLHRGWGRAFVCDFCGEFLSTSAEGQSISAADARARFERLVADHGLDGIVRFHGVVRGEAKADVLRRAHLFLLPTAYPWEGQPFSIIEALAFATPVIATRYRGIPEQVTDGINGRLVAAGDPAGLAAAIRETLDDPHLFARMSREALAHYREHFTQDVHIERLMATIETA